MTKHFIVAKPFLPFLLIFFVLLGLSSSTTSPALAVNEVIVVQTQPVGSPVPPLQVTLVLENNNQDDFAISQSARMVGEVANPSGATLDLVFQVSSDLVDEPDHEDEVLCQYTSSSRNISETCTIPQRFFSADDVGTWQVEFVAQGANSRGTASIDFVVQGFANDERRPTHNESPHVQSINTWTENGQQKSGIQYDDLNFNSLLVYSEIPGVNYWDNPSDSDLPNGRRELHYMQPILVPIVERIEELAEAEGIRLMLNDAWDQDDGHAAGSMHYEGRAIDFDLPFPDYNQSPEDWRGLGRLAYLVEQAVQESGVTYWIWHEHNHVHLSINAERAEELAWGYTCPSGSDCVSHVANDFNSSYSGAAVGAMLLQWQGFSVDMFEFHEYSGANGWDGIECDTMAGLLNHFSDRGWTCSRTQSLDEALRIAAFWTAVTSEENQNGVAFPIAMPMNGLHEGAYHHWVAVDGVISEEYPRQVGTPQNPGGGSYLVRSLYVSDPSLPEGHLNARRPVTRYELEGNINLGSDVLPNLGLMYQPSGPNGTYELVVPAGCAGTSGSLQKATANVTTYGACSSQYSIVSPSGVEPVTYNREVIVQALGPAGATRAELTTVDNAGFQNVFTEVVPVFSSDESTVWEFHWTPASRTATSYTLSVNADYQGGQMHCGAVTVNSSMNADDYAPHVDILTPMHLSQIGIPNTIRVLATDNHFVDEMKVLITGAETRILSGYLSCGVGCYEFSWSPNQEGGYVLKANAKDDERNKGSDQVSVLYGQAPPINVNLNLSDGQVITKNVIIDIQATGGFADITGSLQISGPENSGMDISSFPFSYNWMPPKNGSYTIKITAKDACSTTTSSVSVSVQLQNMVLGDWVKLSPSSNPGVHNGAMVTTNEGLFLFGGIRILDDQLSNRLWKWDGTNWVDLTPFPLPSAWPGAIKYPDMTYDQDRNRIVLLAEDLWEYDLARGIWENRTPNPKPSLWPQPGYSMNTAVYDPQNRKTVLVDIDYTWLWNGVTGTWQKIYTPNINPYSKRNAYQTVALDDLLDIVVLYTTYYNAASKRYVHTWEWNGSSWDQVANSSEDYTPSGTSKERMFSLDTGVLLVDGYYHYQDPKSDFWLWDGTGWTKLQPNSGSPPNTDYPDNPMAFDSENEEFVVFTTSGETWVYRFSLNPRMDQPVPFLFTGKNETTGKLYGPGMKLSWTPTMNPNAVYYEIEYSLDGGLFWFTYTARRPISHGGWINHHGILNCGFGFGYCLEHWQDYLYRVRVLDGSGNALTDWSNVVSAKSWPWPTHVELSEPDPSGPYINDETVTMRLVNSYGPNLYVDWQIVDNYTAHHIVEAGCRDGYVWQDPETRYCSISVFKGSAELGGIFKLASPALEQEVSVEVWAKATGNYPSGEVYTDSDHHVLGFIRRPPPDHLP